MMLVYVLAMVRLQASKFLSSSVVLFVDDNRELSSARAIAITGARTAKVPMLRARVTPFCCSYLQAATPLTVFVALHGVANLPVAVQVKLNEPPDNVTVLVLDTTTPSLLVHWKLGSG